MVLAQQPILVRTITKTSRRLYDVQAANTASNPRKQCTELDSAES